MMGSMLIGDISRKDQLQTLLLLPVASSISLSLGVLLSDWIWLNMPAFLLVSFGVVAARRYGARAVAVGMGVYLAYFFSLFFPISPETLPWLILDIFIACAIGTAVRMLLLPEAPSHVFNRTMRAYRAKLSRHLSEITEALERNDNKNLRRLIVSYTRLNETALFLDEFVDRGHARSDLSPGQRQTLQASIFELELANRDVFDRVLALAANPEFKGKVRSYIVELIRGISLKEPVLVANLSAGEFEGELKDLVFDLERAVSNYHRVLISEIPYKESAGTSDEPKSPTSQQANQSGFLVHPTTKQGIQAALATAIASVMGAGISPERWYWAAITAFVIFAGATRGENLNRALQRVAGTLAGLLVGFVLAQAISGKVLTEVTLIFVCVFFGIYYLRSAYIWTTAWFSLMVAIFFSLMGQFSNEFLMLRMEETAVGALSAALVTVLVFPVNTRSALRSALSKVFIAQAELLNALSRSPSLALDRRERLRLVRALEREFVKFRQLVGPLSTRWIPTQVSGLEVLVYEVAILIHFNRRLAAFPQAEGEGSLEKAERACAELAANAVEIARKLERPGSIEIASRAEAKFTPTGRLHVSYVIDRIGAIMRDIDTRLQSTEYKNTKQRKR